MGWKLFIDDDADTVRQPSITVECPRWRERMGLKSRLLDLSHLGPWKIARSSEEAIHLVDVNGMPSFISFDHDLADGRDGISVARFLIETDLNGDHRFPEDFAFEVHSANPVGRANITSLLQSYLRHREQER